MSNFQGPEQGAGRNWREARDAHLVRRQPLHLHLHRLRLQLACHSGHPLLDALTAIFGGIAAKVQISFTEKEMKAYGRAGAVAEEVLAAVRTVVAFGGQEKEVATFSKLVEDARSKGVQRGLLTGLAGGLSFGVKSAMYGLAFWYGIKCIMDDREGEVGWFLYHFYFLSHFCHFEGVPIMSL